MVVEIRKKNRKSPCGSCLLRIGIFWGEKVFEQKSPECTLTVHDQRKVEDQKEREREFCEIADGFFRADEKVLPGSEMAAYGHHDRNLGSNDTEPSEDLKSAAVQRTAVCDIIEGGRFMQPDPLPGQFPVLSMFRFRHIVFLPQGVVVFPQSTVSLQEVPDLSRARDGYSPCEA